MSSHGGNLSRTEQALVAALVSVIVKELREGLQPVASKT